MQRAISVKVECALSICPLEVLCRGPAKNRDVKWDEEKLRSLSIIKDLANENCCKISEILFFIYGLLGISFTTKYFE